MTPAPFDNLTDQIYEAALIPQMWPSVLDRLCEVAGGVSASMFTSDLNRVSAWVTNEKYRCLFTDWLAERWPERAERTKRLVKKQHLGFVTVFDVFTEEEFRNDPEHVEFLRPRGLGISTGTFMPMLSGDIVVYSIEALLGVPAFSPDRIAQLDGLRPHLARAGAIAARLGLERARAAADAFEVIALPAATLSHSGVMLEANKLFETLIPAAFQNRTGRLTLHNAAADRLFADLFNGGRHDPAIASIPIPAEQDAPPIVIHLLPIRRQAQDIFSNAGWLCVAVPILPKQMPRIELLQALFDLTPAEAKVARAVAEAKTIDTLSASLGVSRETVRTQLKSVFVKTGVTRQAELAAMLAGIQIPK